MNYLNPRLSSPWIVSGTSTSVIFSRQFRLFSIKAQRFILYVRNQYFSGLENEGAENKKK